MRKYFEWSEAGTTNILPELAPGRRYRILASPLSANEETASATLHEGSTVPSSGSDKVVDFVDSVRHTNGEALIAPYVGGSGSGIYLTAVSTDAGITSGRGMIVYLEEST